MKAAEWLFRSFGERDPQGRVARRPQCLKDLIAVAGGDSDGSKVVIDAISTRFVLGLLLLKHIYALSDEGVCNRRVHDPYFEYFTGEEFFQHAVPHERSDLSHWRKRLGDRPDLLREPAGGA